MAAEVREGLTSPEPWLPCKYFYDDVGSRLFDEITRLPEYYQTRTEEKILEECADEVVALVRPRELVELGSGSGRKVRLLLDAMRRRRLLERCILFDINRSSLQESVQRLSAAYPRLEARGIVGDFTKDLALLGRGGGRLTAFLGGTIGNLHPREVPGFLARLGATLEAGDGFLLGVDLVKDPIRLEAAYNDSAGVTARFNLNILQVLNDRLGANFELDAFEHVAFYDRERAWIEMRVRARRPLRVRVPGAGVELNLGRGDEIRTEISCKYTQASLVALLPGTGLRPQRWFKDPEDLFALVLMEPEKSEDSRTPTTRGHSAGRPGSS